ncbi:MAG: TRAP transporter large permease [Bacteroidota bacterium]
MSASPLPPLMVLALFAALLAGFPVAFSIAAVAFAFGAAGLALGAFPPAFLFAIPLRVLGILLNDNLLAIPFFVFIGLLLERSGIAEDMLDAFGRLLAPVRGGLAYAVVLVGAALAATTGIVSASVVAMGLTTLPVMLRYGYSPALASGVIAASGTLAQMIPPSIVLIVLAEQMDVELPQIYRGALGPSALIVGLYLLFLYLASRFYPGALPAAPASAQGERLRTRLRRALVNALPPVAIVGALLASIFLGIATPTESGAVGALATLFYGRARGKLTPASLRQAMDATGILCSCIIFLLFGATCFSLVFRGFDGPLWIEAAFAHLPGGRLGFLVSVNALIFLLAFFLDFFEIAFIVVPLIEPVSAKLGINPLWLSVVLAVNMQTSFMYPPFGLALYNLRSVAPPGLRTSQIYRGVAPFIAIQVIALALIIAFPRIVTLEPAEKERLDRLLLERRIETGAHKGR